MKKRIPLYALGVVAMALGITLLNRSDLGTTPLSSIPYVLSKLLAGQDFFTFGLLTLLFHSACILLQVAVCRRVTVQMVLQFPLAIAFSALLDLFMSWLVLPAPALWLRALLCAAGIALSALGIVLIVRAGLMLPAPDALLHAVSQRTGRPLVQVKIVGDVTWVTVAGAALPVAPAVHGYGGAGAAAGRLLWRGAGHRRGHALRHVFHRPPGRRVQKTALLCRARGVTRAPAPGGCKTSSRYNRTGNRIWRPHCGGVICRPAGRAGSPCR